MTTNETKEKELTKEMQLAEFNFKNTDNVLEDVCSIIDSARDYAYQAVNVALIKRNWLIGYRIAKEELKVKERANYGKEIIKELAKKINRKVWKGFYKNQSL